MTKKRLVVALACYAILAVIAWTTQEGNFRLALMVLFAGLAVKSWAATRNSP